jgi:DAK2 domain fusion protein YloV
VPVVTEQTWDGHGLLAALRHAAVVLRASLDEVNALNVFPVPDGDTGSNMLATVHAAIAEAEEIPPKERTVTRVAASISLGALMGARGNSGVILSQLLRGMGDAITGADAVDGELLARAFIRGCETAYSAVANPVDGTILTVARDIAAVAKSALERHDPLETVLNVAVSEAAASVLRTPDLLPVLARAGVVDAGGRGLELMLRGALASIAEPHVPNDVDFSSDIALPTWDGLEVDGFGYETVFVILPPDGSRLDINNIRSRLDQIGNSVLVAGDERAVKVHVHNERPDEVVGFGLTQGSLSRISIENLDRQATNVRERARANADRSVLVQSHMTMPGPAIVAVAAGDGWARVFGALGAAAIVQGGQGANPSAGEIAESIKSTGRPQAIVIVNNANVRMAADQAGGLCPGVDVGVVPTRNSAEGVAALLAFDPTLDLKRATKLMTEASRKVKTLQVTLAVRDARIGRRRVHRGEYIVLGPNDGIVAADTDRVGAMRTALEKFDHGYELLTLYRGRDVDHATAQGVRDSLAAGLDGIEVELVDGGQPHYDFLISAE